MQPLIFLLMSVSLAAATQAAQSIGPVTATPPRLTLAMTLRVQVGPPTELGEVPITGAAYRRSLEMVPGRSLHLGLALAWPR